MDINSEWVVIGKVVLAMILGGLVGAEREWAAKPAGLRTHMLVAGASAMFVILGDIMVHQFSQTNITDLVRSDPIRIMEAIITGISFLGAGTIIFKDHKHSVEGLTTAASILFISGLGMAVALDEFLIAIILTFVAIAILFGLGIIQDWIDAKQPDAKQKES